MSNKTLMDEASMQAAEENIPRLAEQAGYAAHQRALQQTGRVVMKSVDGFLVEIRANGTVVVLKALPASMSVKAGTVLRRATKADSGKAKKQ